MVLLLRVPLRSFLLWFGCRDRFPRVWYLREVLAMTEAAAECRVIVIASW
jgi:hypothetical protein